MRGRGAGLLLATTVVAGVLGAGAVPAQAAKPPPSSCALVPDSTVPDWAVGDLQTVFYLTTGCSTSTKPVRFRVVEGRVPRGTELFTQGVSSAGITGRPTTEGLVTFTLLVRDQTGTKDTETYSINVVAPQPLAITNPTDTLSPGTVGESYCCGNLFVDGGVAPYMWSLVGGQLPPGLSLSSSPGRVTGTPTAAGTYTFTVRVTDDRGATAERTFSITVS